VILGIDTSLGTTVAVVEDDGLIRAHADSADPLAHAEVIGTLLERVLDASQEAPAVGAASAPDAPRITHVAAGMGPGPYTGLRIGIAAARAFALARGIPVVPVVSHDAVALDVLVRSALLDSDSGRFAVVTDARRREFAFSVYDGLDEDGLPVRIGGPSLAHRDRIDDDLAALGARRVDAGSASAAMIGLAASRALAAGREIASREALYLRSPDVALPSAMKKVIR